MTLLYALLPVAVVALGWFTTKTKLHHTNDRVERTDTSSNQRRNKPWSINTRRLMIILVSSVSLWLGSQLTLFFNNYETSTGSPLERALAVGQKQEQEIKHEHKDSDHVLFGERPEGMFHSGKKQIICHGSPRTASTLLFNMVAVCNFLYLKRNEPQLVPKIESKYAKKGIQLDTSSDGLQIYKTHLDLDKLVTHDAVVFTTAMNRAEAATTKVNLKKQGLDVRYVQDMQTLKEEGIPRIAHDFVVGYGLPKDDEERLIEFFSSWEVLRQCCGEQMSKYWRNDLTPEIYQRVTLSGIVEKNHPFCADHNIDEVEKAFMGTELYKWLGEHDNMRAFNKPSLRDKELNGTYCSSYNERVRTEALNFYGQPMVKDDIRTGDWTEEEHGLFLSSVKQFGTGKWNKISNIVKTRTPMQVYWHMQEKDIREWLMSHFEEEKDQVRSLDRPVEDDNYGVGGQVFFAFDETGKIRLIDKRDEAGKHNN